MQILVEVPASLPDAIQCTPQQFIQEAKMAMGIKLYEMKQLPELLRAWIAHRLML